MLKGIRVLELAGLAPVPHCGLLLADSGADVTIIERADGGEMVEQRLNRGKKTIKVDLKSPEGLKQVHDLCRSSDVLLDPFRPGVLEKMGLDPVNLLEENKGLIVCRLTGYGQIGPMSHVAGHDINYVSLTGLMPTLNGQNRGNPWPPVNLLADFAGGGLTAAFGITSALFGREKNGGNGCIIDCSMVEGLSYLGSFINHYHDQPHLFTDRNCAFGSECPIYRTYETKDGKYMAVGALEPKFHMALFEILGLDFNSSDVFSQPTEVVNELEKVFKTKTRDEWATIFDGTDACCTPVLDLNESGDFPQNSTRKTFIKENGKWIPEPAPKFYSKEEFAKLRSKL